MRSLARHSAALVSVLAALALGAGEAAADPVTAVGDHCNLITGSEQFRPALDPIPSATTMTLTASGTGCADLRLLDSAYPPVTAGTVTISGRFTGTASTLISSFTGSGSYVFHPDDGSRSRVFDFNQTCVLMVAGNCTFLGTFETEPDLRGIAELTPAPALNLDLIGPVNRIDYLEFAPLLFALLLTNNNNNPGNNERDNRTPVPIVAG